MKSNTPDQPATAKPTDWMNQSNLGMGLASMFSDMASAHYPVLATFEVPL